MKRVLFITDSLGAPRRTPEECVFDDLWCYKVSKALGNVEAVYYNVNGLDTNKLYAEIQGELTLYNPDIVILQVGIVDCAPRALKRKEQKFISKLIFIRNIIHRFIRKNYSVITRIRDISYVSPEKFENNLIRIKENFAGIPVFVVAIGKPSKKYIKKSPLIEKRYLIYNNILKNIFKDYCIDPFGELNNNEIENIFMSDLHHLNKKGQELVAQCVAKKISNLTV